MNRQNNQRIRKRSHHVTSKSDRVVPTQNFASDFNDYAAVTHEESSTPFVQDDNNNMNLNSLWVEALVKYEKTLKDERVCS